MNPYAFYLIHSAVWLVFGVSFGYWLSSRRIASLKRRLDLERTLNGPGRFNPPTTFPRARLFHR